MRHNTSRTITALCAVAVVLVLGGCGRDTNDPAPTTVTVTPGSGSDGHTEIPDPLAETTADPGTAAAAALAAMFGWRPATDPSPGTALTRALPYLTGALADTARQAPDPALLPPEWEAWARNLDALTAVAVPIPDDPRNQIRGANAQQVFEVRQTVLHTNGQTTPRQPMLIVAQLDRTDDGWQLSSYRIDEMTAGPR